MIAATSMPEPPELPEVETPSALDHGVHASVPERVYHGRVLGLASKSALDLVHRSPAHYKAWVDGHEAPPTPAMVFGRALHMALLEPERFARKFATQPGFGDCRFKENKARRDEWRRDNAGREPISSADAERIAGMVASVRAHPLASKLLVGGRAELTVRWRDGGTGLECKVRADYYVQDRGLLIDVKSTEDAGPTEFAKSCARYGYHRQHAFYRDGFRAAKLPAEHFVFIAVEKEPPYAVATYVLDDDAVARGEDSIADDMATLARCLKTGEWPGYETSIRVLTLPRWAA